MPPLRALLQPPPATPGQMPARPQSAPLTPAEKLMTLAMGLFGVGEPQAEEFTNEEAFSSARGPYALGQLASILGPVALGMAAKLSRAEAPAQTIRAYHGSPHDFERFDLSKIGTGEGAQAYGHGLYFAENQNVAKEYQKVLARDTISIDGVPYQATTTANAAKPGNYAAEALTRFNGDVGAAAEWLESWGAQYPDEAAKMLRKAKSIEAHKGRTYEVNIHASPDELLDWDKPLSQQSPKVQEALAKSKVLPDWFSEWSAITKRQDEIAELPTAVHRSNPAIAAESDALDARLQALRQKIGQQGQHWAMGRYNQGAKGEDVYRNFGDPVVAAEKLKDAGIKGIQYLDQGSRAAGEGTKNFVIFDDKIIEIAKKYGISLPVAASLYKWQQSQKGVE